MGKRRGGGGPRGRRKKKKSKHFVDAYYRGGEASDDDAAAAAPGRVQVIEETYENERGEDSAVADPAAVDNVAPEEEEEEEEETSYSKLLGLFGSDRKAAKLFEEEEEEEEVEGEEAEGEEEEEEEEDEEEEEEEDDEEEDEEAEGSDAEGSDAEGSDEEGSDTENSSDSDSDSDADAASPSGASSFSRWFSHEMSDAQVAELEAAGAPKLRRDGETPAGLKLSSVARGVLAPVASLAAVRARKRVREHWRRARALAADAPDLTPTQSELFGALNEYACVFHTNTDHKRMAKARETYALHVVNHVTHKRSLVLRNKERQRAAEERGAEATRVADQGFTRPQVLILTPFRATALRVVRKLLRLLPGPLQVHEKKRFADEFETPTERNASKPADWNALFRGNVDDCFRVGMQVSRRHVRLFSNFYASDIIVASPLGLRLTIQEGDYDFLSSLDMVVVEQADVLAMQNIDHLEFVLDHCNLLTRESHDEDITRIRPYVLQGWAKWYRQLVVFARAPSPELNALVLRRANARGMVVYRRPAHSGVLARVVPQTRQVFQRFASRDVETHADRRFAYFCSKFAALRQAVDTHVLLFVPSFFDFVRVRNFLKDEDEDFISVSEYTPTDDVPRARQFFRDGRVKFFLFTERFHFYRRYHIHRRGALQHTPHSTRHTPQHTPHTTARHTPQHTPHAPLDTASCTRGAKHLVMYELPENEHYYSEIVNMLPSHESSVTVLYSQLDKMRLERVVGSSRARKMLRGDKSTYLFC